MVVIYILINLMFNVIQFCLKLIENCKTWLRDDSPPPILSSSSFLPSSWTTLFSLAQCFSLLPCLSHSDATVFLCFVNFQFILISLFSPPFLSTYDWDFVPISSRIISKCFAYCWVDRIFQFIYNLFRKLKFVIKSNYYKK